MAQRLDAADRRERILATATDLMARNGYRGVTLRALARACQMTAPGLLHHFDGMPEVLLAALERRDEADRRALAPALARARTVREVLDAVVAHNASDPVGARFFATVQAEALDHEHPAHDWFLRRSERYAGEIHHLLDDGPDADPSDARLLGAVLDGLQARWLLDPASFPLVESWRRAADLLFAPQAAAHSSR